MRHYFCEALNKDQRYMGLYEGQNGEIFVTGEIRAGDKNGLVE